MASRYTAPDRDGLACAAILLDDFYKATSPRERLILAAEFRALTARFGLSVADRQKLDWDYISDRPRERRDEDDRETKGDPRGVLKPS